MVDAIASRFYSSEHGGATEAILNANDGLASYGPLLPEGLKIIIPDLPPAQPAQLATVSLWS
ncbi:phage tail protein [Methylocystis heyeri]|uniref:Phage tail protein n=2 Tax=Methylocystis heyeri TaxID=391905 RepID=A0A6B8KKG5_9HYPH|nr:phage tail protein [Methylocystis heyeri]